LIADELGLTMEEVIEAIVHHGREIDKLNVKIS
jgi:hypothetical protein